VGSLSRIKLSFSDRSELEAVLDVGRVALQHICTFTAKDWREPEFPSRAATSVRAEEILELLARAESEGSLEVVANHFDWSCLMTTMAFYFRESNPCGASRDRALAAWICMRTKLDKDPLIAELKAMGKRVDRAEERIGRLKKKLASAEADFVAEKVELDKFMRDNLD